MTLRWVSMFNTSDGSRALVTEFRGKTFFMPDSGLTIGFIYKHEGARNEMIGTASAYGRKAIDFALAEKLVLQSMEERQK